VAFLFGDSHPVDTTSSAIQAGFDGANPIADGPEALWPEVVGEDQMPEGPYHLVWALAGHFHPLLIVVGQVDQAIRCASV